MNGRLLQWLEDYLTNRSHFTKVNGKLSEARDKRYGVPQGSLLGPRLYTIYVNDFPESVTKGELYMFADDTTIFTIGKSVDEVSIVLQEVMDEVLTWCNFNQLTIHEGKTDVLILDSKNFIGPLLPIKLGQSLIQYKSYSDCLGVRIDSKLSWNDHIKRACKSFNGKKKLMRHLRLPKEVLETLYVRTIIPSVTYGIAVWGSCSASLCNDLERIHIRAARLIHKAPKDIGNVGVLNFVGLNTLKYMYTKRILTLTHSAYYNDSIDEINNLKVRGTIKYSFRIT